MTRDYVLRVRINENEKKIIDRRAKMAKVSTSDFVRQWIQSMARTTIGTGKVDQR